MDTEKKKFDDIRKPLENNGYDIVKMIGKGAFGEVILVRDSTCMEMLRKHRHTVRGEDHKQKPSEEETLLAEVY